MADNGKNGSQWRLPPPPPAIRGGGARQAAQSLGTPLDFQRGAGTGAVSDGAVTSQDPATGEPQTPAPRKQATETLAARAGALSDEIDFPDFVAGLVHGTFDAIVEASIRQMESYADLVSAIAKSVDQFTQENVTLNQARDWLAQTYPKDLYLDMSDTPTLRPRSAAGEDGDQARSPDWLKDFQLEGEELTAELIEDSLVPQARARIGQSRQQTLATLVLLGLNRVVVRDGSISARLRFRAAAADKAKVDYAVSDDPSGASNWGVKGSSTYAMPSTKVSTVGVNAQSDTQLNTELFGEVKINFASETLPLERFADDARRTLLERRAKPGSGTPARSAAPAEPAAAPSTAPAPQSAPTPRPAVPQAPEAKP